jgi:hypothetical protein
MNIIFGDSVNTIPDQYTVLELDTFRTVDSDKTITAYCLVEKLALNEFATMESYKKIHADLIDAYRNQHWNYCEQAIDGLMGKWSGELDTFYIDLLNRVKQHKENGVPDNWTAIIIKTQTQNQS